MQLKYDCHDKFFKIIKMSTSEVVSSPITGHPPEFNVRLLFFSHLVASESL